MERLIFLHVNIKFCLENFFFENEILIFFIAVFKIIKDPLAPLKSFEQIWWP